MWKCSRTSAVLFLVFVLLTVLTACSGKGTDSSQAQADDTQAAAVNTAPAEAETVEASLPAGNTQATADNLVGSWKQVEAPDQFVNITKTDSGYEYEDNDGKYPAAFADGKLTVKATETESAQAYVDDKTGHLVVVFQGGMTEYVKK